MVRSIPIAADSLEARRAARSEGTAIVAMIPMIATTMSNSTRENPCSFFMCHSPGAYVARRLFRAIRGERKGGRAPSADRPPLIVGQVHSPSCYFKLACVERGALAGSQSHNTAGEADDLILDHAVRLRAV